MKKDKKSLYLSIMVGCFIVSTHFSYTYCKENNVFGNETVASYVQTEENKPQFHKNKYLYALTKEEYELISKLVISEAGDENDDTKKLVIDVVLNRLDSVYFPNNIKEVIYQKNQFASVTNGDINLIESTVDIKNLIDEEIKVKTSKDVIYFNRGKYGKYGTPFFKSGDLYFSYDERTGE